MNFWIVSADPGEAVFECEPGEYHDNPLGMVHGGLACTLLDTVVGCAAHTTLPKGVGYTSIDLNVSYLRPITSASGVIRATGRVVKGGQRVIFASGRDRGCRGPHARDRHELAAGAERLTRGVLGAAPAAPDTGPR